MSIKVHLKVTTEVNDQRKALNLTWREIIMAGLAASEKPKESSEVLKNLDTHIKKALASLITACNLIEKEP